MLSADDQSRLYWISGSVCAGKTTVSSAIAAQRGWNAYHADEWLDSHRERATPEKHPVFHATSHITGDALWLRPVEEQIRTDEIGADEEVDLILEDVVQMLRQDPRPLVVDGYVRPSRLLPLLPSKNRCFYLIATEAFQLERYRQRAWIHDVLAKTSAKEQAWNNWMQRDLASARMLEREVRENGMPWLSVDGSLSLQETVSRILKGFGG